MQDRAPLLWLENGPPVWLSTAVVGAVAVGALALSMWRRSRSSGKVNTAGGPAAVRKGQAPGGLLPAARDVTGPLEQQIEAIGRHLIASGSSAAAIAVVRDGQLQISRFGEAANTGDHPVRFELGAVTPLFTVLALQELVARGHLHWNTPVRDLLPDTYRTLADGTTTVHHLATHTSGLPPLPKFWLERTSHSDQLLATISREQVCQAFVRDEGRATVRARRSVASDHGMGLLGVLIEEATSASYESVVTDTVLAPIGMGETRVTLDHTQLADVASRRSAKGAVPARALSTGLHGAYGMTSTIEDMAQLLISATQGTAVDWPQSWTAVEAIERVPALLAWQGPTTPAPTRAVFLEGAMQKSASYLAIFPERGMGMVVLSAGPSAPVPAVSRFLMERMASVSFSRAVPAIPTAPVASTPAES